LKTVSIVCEYNPFHSGHKYQLDKIKAEYGEDVCIVAIMSGNYTQRGDIAIADKFLRAKAAALEGVSLVLELPFPFSMQSAEFFASSAIHIMLNAVSSDVISFGSECGDAATLETVAKNMCRPEFENAFLQLKNTDNSIGHPALCELAYKNTYNDSLAHIFEQPNNVLAIEYLRAIYKQNKDIELHTFKRIGAQHNDSEQTDDKYASATFIRELFHKGDTEKALSFLPDNSAQEYLRAFEQKSLPTNSNRLSNAVLAFLRINKPTSAAADAVGGIEHRIHSCSIDARDLEELITLVSTKRYTNARIRRAIWNSYFGITSSDIKKLPCYTQVLAMDEKGRKKLKEIKKTSKIAILTKPADYVFLNDDAKTQAESANRADLIFSLAKPSIPPGNEFLRQSPFCKK
jgi:predicted nucleotidyltransferase